MKLIHIATSSLLCLAGMVSAEEPDHQPTTPPNTLSPGETAAGWKLLFDGKTTAGWRGFQKQGFPSQGWTVENGCLKCLGGEGGDILTTSSFTNFELTWEWRLSPQGNSGVKYFVDEKRADSSGKVYNSALAHEYQMIDDKDYVAEPLTAKKMTGAWYDVIAPEGAKPAPVGEFNSSRLILRGKHVEHWLNGQPVVSYVTDSAESAAAIARSKFKDVAGYAAKIDTPILLQNHSTVAWYRNLKLRELP